MMSFRTSTIDAQMYCAECNKATRFVRGIYCSADVRQGGGGVRTMQTSLRFGLNPPPSLQAAAATQRERRSGSA